MCIFYYIISVLWYDTIGLLFVTKEKRSVCFNHIKSTKWAKILSNILKIVYQSRLLSSVADPFFATDPQHNMTDTVILNFLSKNGFLYISFLFLTVFNTFLCLYTNIK